MISAKAVAPAFSSPLPAPLFLSAAHLRCREEEHHIGNMNYVVIDAGAFVVIDLQRGAAVFYESSSVASFGLWQTNFILDIRRKLKRSCQGANFLPFCLYRDRDVKDCFDRCLFRCV